METMRIAIGSRSIDIPLSDRLLEEVQTDDDFCDEYKYPSVDVICAFGQFLVDHCGAQVSYREVSPPKRYRTRYMSVVRAEEVKRQRDFIEECKEGELLGSSGTGNKAPGSGVISPLP